MTGAEISEDFRKMEELQRLLLLCRMVIDQAMLGNDYLILFMKREKWQEFVGMVMELDKKVINQV